MNEVSNEQEALLAETEKIFRAAAGILGVSVEQINQEADVLPMLSLFAHADRTEEKNAEIQTLALSLIRTSVEHFEDTKTKLIHNMGQMHVGEIQIQTQLKNEQIALQSQLERARKFIETKTESTTRTISALAQNISSLLHPSTKSIQMKGRRPEDQITEEIERLTARQEATKQTLRQLEDELTQSPQIRAILNEIKQNERLINESLLSRQALDQAFFEECQELDQEALYFETMRALFVVSAITHEQNFETAVYEASETDEEILNLITSEPKIEKRAADLLPLFTPLPQSELLAFAQESALIRPTSELLEEEEETVSGDEKTYTPITILQAAEDFTERVCGQSEGASQMPAFLKLESPALKQFKDCAEGQEEPQEELIETYSKNVHATLNAIHSQAISLERVLDDPSIVPKKIAEWERFVNLILPYLEAPFEGVKLNKIPSEIGIVSQHRAVAHYALQAELYESTGMEAIMHATAREYGVNMNPDIRLVPLATTRENASGHRTDDRKESYLVPFLEMHPLNTYGGGTLCTIVDQEMKYPHLRYISFPDFASKAEEIVQKIKQSERESQKRTQRRRNLQSETDKGMEYRHQLIMLTREYGVAFGELLYGMSSSALLNNIPNTRLELTEAEQDAMLALSKKAFEETIAEYLEENGVVATSCENFQSIVETAAERSINYLKIMLEKSEENGIYGHGVLQFFVIAGRKFGPFLGYTAHHELMLTLTREHVNAMMNQLIDKWFTPCLQKVLPDINPTQPLIAQPDTYANPIPTLKALLLPNEIWMATRALAKHEMKQTQKSAGAESRTPQKTKQEIQQDRREQFVLGTTSHDELFNLLIDAGYGDLAVAKQSREIRVPGRAPEQWVKRAVDYYKITPDGAALLWSDLCDGTLLKNIYAVLFKDA